MIIFSLMASLFGLWLLLILNQQLVACGFVAATALAVLLPLPLAHLPNNGDALFPP
jgi:hypothetical protein